VPSDIRYFFDEHIPNAAAGALRRDGADVLTAAEAGRLSLPDDEQLRFATAEGRVMVTQDDDYLTLAGVFFATGEEFEGIAYSHPDKYQHNVSGLIRALLLVNGAMTAAELRNDIIYL
jgi:predicted nuclease of predicted toxin-antitoxin system